MLKVRALNNQFAAVPPKINKQLPRKCLIIVQIKHNKLSVKQNKKQLQLKSSLQDSSKSFDGSPKGEITEKDTDLGNGGGSNSDGQNIGYSGDGGHEGGNQEILAVLAASGKSIESFPKPFRWALENGKVTVAQLKRYLELQSKFIFRLFLPIEGFQERFMADPGFIIKLAIEVGIGVCTKSSAEYAKRGKNFTKELDFVFANVTMAIIADIMLVWLPAPTLSFRGQTGSVLQKGRVGQYLSTLPDNAFQIVQPGMNRFTLGQRFGAIMVNGVKLFGVGTMASLFGVGLINGLTFIRQQIDPDFFPLNPPQDIFKTSLIYGSYMASSSNLRYQILAGIIEERGVEKFFAGNSRACALLSFIFRTSNTFLGSLLWVDYIRLFGMQKGESH